MYKGDDACVTREEKSDQLLRDIKKEEKKEKRKKHLLTLLKILLIIAVLIGLLVLYARYAATKGIIVNEEKITSSLLPSTFNGFKVIQFSDLHYGSTVNLDDVKDLVEQINRRHPDIVVFTGDLLEDEQPSEILIKDLSAVLDSIDAPLGKYAVTGNHDYNDNYFIDIMARSHFKILDNSYELIYKEGYDPIILVGLASTYQNNRNIEEAFSYFKTEGANSNIYTMLLLHEPDSLDTVLVDYKVDLALAGHSHNGQIRLPFIGSIVKVNGAKKYSEPYYKIDNTELYVSGGLGTSDYYYRLFNRPGINFFRFEKTLPE